LVKPKEEVDEAANDNHQVQALNLQVQTLQQQNQELEKQHTNIQKMYHRLQKKHQKALPEFYEILCFLYVLVIVFGHAS
jgi:predicted  nucleic acid-binding Zn-ribbon protein